MFLQTIPAIFPSLGERAAAALSHSLGAAAAVNTGAELEQGIAPLGAAPTPGASPGRLGAAFAAQVGLTLDRVPVHERTHVELTALEGASTEMKDIRGEALREARVFFRVAIAVLLAGIVVIFAGTLLLGLGNLTPGVVTAGGGIVSDFISLVLFKYYKDSHDRSDKYAADLHRLERAKMGLELISKLTDPTVRDAAIQQLAEELAARAGA